MTPASSRRTFGSMPSHPKDLYTSPCLCWCICLRSLWFNLPLPLAIFVFKLSHKARSFGRLKANWRQRLRKRRKSDLEPFLCPPQPGLLPYHGDIWMSKLCNEFSLPKIWTVSGVISIQKLCERKESRRLWMCMFAEKRAMDPNRQFLAGLLLVRLFLTEWQVFSFFKIKLI